MQRGPKRLDITWVVEAMCVATAVADVAHLAPRNPVPPRCKIVDVRTLSQTVEQLALPPPAD